MSQEAKVIVQLRELILSGELKGGERVLEVALAERLGTSRTPVRYALSVLAAEGLIVGGGKRGFSVRSFTVQDIADAIDVRGALEGLAARLAAEKGVSAEILIALKRCLAEGDALLEKGAIGKDDDEAYERINREFHSLIVTAAGSDYLRNAISLNDRLPFAAAGAVALSIHNPSLHSAQYNMLVTAHAQHHAVVEAIERRESWRVQSLMQEHALIAKKNLTMMAKINDEILDPSTLMTSGRIQELRLMSAA